MMFFKYPKLKAHLRFDPISSQELLVRDEEGGRHLLKGEIFVQLSQWLENRLSHQEILDQAFEQFSPEEVYYALFQLQKLGYLYEGESVQIAPQWQGVLQSLSLLVEEAQVKLENWSLEIESLNGDLETAQIALGFFEEYPFSKRLSMNRSDASFGSFRDLSLSASAPMAPSAYDTESEKQNLIENTSKSASLLSSWTVSKKGTSKLKIFITDHYRRKELLEWNSIAQEKKIPWLLIKANGLKGWVGPLFVPGKTPCYECLRAALERNQSEVIWAENKLEAEKPLPESSDFIPFLRDMVFAKAAFEIFRWIVDSSKLEGNLITLDLAQEFQFHRVIPRSFCPCLSHPKVVTDWNLISDAIQSTDGGYRSVDPEFTWEKYHSLISPLTGLIHSVQLSSNYSGSFVYRAIHNRMRNFSEELLKAGKYRDSSCGKGKTISQAKTGALCEALERISGIYQGNEPRIRSSFTELGSKAIHPNEVDLFSSHQYATRKEWNTICDPFNLVPRPLDPEELTDWSALWSLTRKREKWLPTACCYFSYPPSLEPFAVGNSNGCAAGNTIEEAILQGLFELIERDSTALWWYNQLQMPQVDLESFQNFFFDRITQELEKRGRKLWVLDLTFDLPVPVFAALSTHKEHDLLLGLGAHLDPEIGMSRALSELIQLECSSKEGSPLNLSREQEKSPYFFPSSFIKAKKDYHKYAAQTIKQTILDLIQWLEKKNLEVFVFNQTRTEIGLPVVKTVVPGLRHFWKRLAPGRLYEVPYKLGFLSRPLSEEELNPHPITI